MTTDHIGRHLTIVVCAAGPASDVDILVKASRADNWSVNLIATPDALSFMDIPGLEHLSGSPIRSQPRSPQTPRTHPTRPPDAIIVAPATFNTINKLAAGIADTYALVVLAEAIGQGTPVIIVPFVNAALAARTPYQRALALLRDERIRIVEGEADHWLPHPQGTGAAQQPTFPWLAAFAEARLALCRPL